MRYVLALAVVFVLSGAFMRWADRWGQATPGGQDLSIGLKLWPVFLYGGLAVLPISAVVAVVKAVA